MAILTLEEVLSAAERDDNEGFCVSCGAGAYGVEPDAREYECEECGARTVYGADQLLLEGFVGF